MWPLTEKIDFTTFKRILGLSVLYRFFHFKVDFFPLAVRLSVCLLASFLFLFVCSFVYLCVCIAPSLPLPLSLSLSIAVLWTVGPCFLDEREHNYCNFLQKH